MADVSFWQSIDGRWKQLKRWTLHIVAGTPLGAVAGAIWYDGTEQRPKWHDGTNARNFGGYVSSGVSSSPGPEWTAAGGASVTMAACKCRLYDNADFLGEPKEYDIPAKTLTLTDGADQMCVVHYNAGSPEYAIVDAWDTAAYNLSNVVTVYRFWYAFGDIHSASVDSLGLGLTEKQALRIGQTDYYKRIGGVGLEPSLIGLTLSVSSAGVWAGPVQMAIAAFASGSDSMEYIYKTSAGAWVSVDSTTIPNTLYNPPAGLATLSNSSKWTALYIYRTIGDAKECYIVLDTAEYNSETSAQESTPRVDVPRIIQSHCVLVGRILIQKDATTGTVESAWRTAFGTGGGVTTHNDLSGLQGGEIGYYGHLTAAQVVQAPRLLLGTCATAQATTAKEVALPGYTLNAGDVIVVRFTYGSANTSTLNVNGTGAKAIYSLGGLTNTTTWAAGDFVCLLYDGGYWNVLWTRGSGSSMGTINLLAMKSDITELDANNVNYPVLWGTSNKLYQTAAKLYFNPSTGFLQATKVGVIGGTSSGFMKANGTVDSTTYAPENHASSATKYGVATSGNYGHVKLYDLLSNGVVDGAPTVNAVYDAVTSLANSKQDVLTFDTTPTDGSTNPVTSNGVFDALLPIHTIYKGNSTGSDIWWNSILFSIRKGAAYYDAQGAVLEFFWFGGTNASTVGLCRIAVEFKNQYGQLSYKVEMTEGNSACPVYFDYIDNGTDSVYLNIIPVIKPYSYVGMRLVHDAGYYGLDVGTTEPTSATGIVSPPTVSVITSSATLPAGAPIGKSVFVDNSQSTSSITISAPSGENINVSYGNGASGGGSSASIASYFGKWFVKTSATGWTVAT